MIFTVFCSHKRSFVTIHDDNTAPLEYVTSFFIENITSERILKGGNILIELKNNQNIWFSPKYDVTEVME